MGHIINIIRKINSTYSTFAIIITNTLFLFVVVNIIAFYIPSPIENYHLENLYHPSIKLIKENPALMQKIHEGKTLSDIITIYQESPNVKSHPTLEFMTTPEIGQIYKVGFENCRYDSFITHQNITKIINGSTWIFGGSTAFGCGVGENETISFFLNKMDTPNSYINFGVPAYGQKNEIEKLILLLQKGYKPKSVIFIDGLNDLYSLTKSNLTALETPARTFNSYSHNFNHANSNFVNNFIYSLPLIKLYYDYLAMTMVKNGSVNSALLENIYEKESLYNTNPYLHFKLTEVLSYEPKNTTFYKEKFNSYYQANQKLLEALAEKFKFKYTVYFQPIGPFFSKNPFIVDSNAIKNNNLLYKNVKPIFEDIKNKIKNKNLKSFCDISSADNLCPYPYVDLTHYSKSMNRKIAELILNNQRIGERFK